MCIRDRPEPDVRPPAGLEEPGLEVQPDVADALAVELELHVAHVGRAIAAHDEERHRRAELELERAGVDAERADQRGADDVVDRVGVVARAELEQAVAPGERAQPERQPVSYTHLTLPTSDLV